MAVLPVEDQVPVIARQYAMAALLCSKVSIAMHRILPPIAQLMAVFICDGGAHAGPAQPNVCEREMIAAASRYDVPLAVLYAVGLTETGRRGSLQPFALNVEGAARYPATSGEALQQFAEAQRRGQRLIDVGCMQIDHHFHGRYFRSVEAMFDPRENVDYAARFLRALKAREGSWTLAAARYHAGPNNEPGQKRYVCLVIANMVASGFGGWTPSARAFCGQAVP